MTHPATLLRRALTANAVFSGICGALCVLASASIGGLTGIAGAAILSFPLQTTAGVAANAVALALVVALYWKGRRQVLRATA